MTEHDSLRKDTHTYICGDLDINFVVTVFDPNKLQVLSLKSMVGITTKRTLRVRGSLRGAEVVVLIDSGASCNFIAKRLVEELGLTVSPTQDFGVAIGDGRVLSSSGNAGTYI